MMTQQRKGIFLKEWLAYKPYSKQANTDFYYLNVAQKTLQILQDAMQNLYWNKYFGSKDHTLQEMSCFLTSYLEDLASDTKLWTTFLQEHQSMYDKPLPLINPGEDYIEGEPNYEDLAILIWYYINSIQDEVVYSHNEVWIQKAAAELFELYVERWETAPQNEDLQAFYTLGNNDEPFLEARKLMGKIFLQSYLFQPDTKIFFEQRIKEALRQPGRDVNLVIWDLEQTVLHNQPSRLLGKYANEWLAARLGSKHPNYGAILHMSRRISGIFELEAETKTLYKLRHLASELPFNLTKKSLKGQEEPQQYLSLSLVKYKNDWWMSGASDNFQFSEETIANERKNILRKHAVLAQLDPNWRAEYLRTGLDVFMQMNAGHPIAFGTQKEIKDILEQYNDTVAQSNDALLKQMVPIRTQILIQYIDSFRKAEEKTFTLVYTPDLGLEVVIDLADAFLLPHNTNAQAENSGIQFLEMLTSPAISKQVTEFCMANCGSNIPLFASEEGQAIAQNFDFILRFWKTSQYHSVSL